MKLLYSNHSGKSVYTKTSALNNLIQCETDAVDELIIDNSYVSSDNDCYALSCILKEITNKQISVVLNDTVENHKYLTNKLADSSISVYLEYVDIDINKTLCREDLIVIMQHTKLCLSNSILLKIKTYLQNRKINRSNRTSCNRLKKDFLKSREATKKSWHFGL